MSQSQQRSEVGGRNTRARTKKLEHPNTPDTSISVSDVSTTKTRRQRTVSNTVTDSAKRERSSRKSFALNKSSNTVDTSSKNHVKRTMQVKPLRSKSVSDLAKDGKNTESASPNATPKALAKTGFHIEFAACDLTPKSSPVPVNLSPRRSSKTPKKSPKELASPKSHPIPLIRISKTPRKLILPTDSPLSSTVNGTAEKTTQSSGIKTPTSTHKSKRHTIPGGNKILKNSPTGKSKIKKLSISMKPGVRRFSKSPKIVIKSAKSTSRKSKSPKISLGSKRYSVGTKVNSSPANKRIRISLPKSESKRQTVRKLNETDVSKSVAPTVSTAQSLLREVMTRRKPIVLLERLSMSNDTTPIRITDSVPVKNVTETPTHSPAISLAKSPPLKNTSSIQSNVESDLNPRVSIKLPNKAAAKNTTQEESPRRSHRTLADNVQKASEPLMSSTPYDRKKLLDTFVESVPKLIQRGSPRDRANRSLTTAEITKSLIEDESEPSLCHLNDTSSEKNGEDSDKQEKKDGTYELTEPKTPHLREKVRTRSIQEADSGTKQESKKNFKVRFASSTETIESTKKDSIRRTDKGRIEKTRTASRSSTVKKTLFGKSTPNASTLKSVYAGKLSNSVLPSPRLAKTQRQSNSYIRETGIVSPVVSLSKKSGLTDSVTKNSATKKVPNFGKIHDKLFAKSESLVDAKKRLEERHAVLTSAKAAGQTKPLAKEATNGPYNRFGFKLTKNEAIDYVMKKNPLLSRREQQQKNRAFLKGVRTNKRFELQMKARNIKI